MRIRSLLVGSLLLFGACSTGTGTTTTTSGAEPTTTTADTNPVPESTTTMDTTATTPTTATVTSAAPTTTDPPPPPLTEFELDVAPVADGFDQPILAATRPGDDRLYVADQPGTVSAVALADGSRTRVLDIGDRVRFSGEQGLLGIAFHPVEPDRLVVHYTAQNGDTVLAEFRLDAADPETTEQTILRLDQPASNHNGGMVAFGPDGYLYLGLGDGGGANDQFGHGQDPSTLLGTIIRIDVDSASPYAIPSGNPFADGADGAPEVWIWGLRNPWRFSFDGDHLWVGDVGQGAWEEIDRFDIAPGGDNAGWPLLEGTHCFSVEPCDIDGLTAPIAEYGHTEGRCSVTGGVVYRGADIPDLAGTYLYGDFCTGEVWGLRGADQRLLTDPDDRLLPHLPGLTSFGVGPDGEVYLMQAQGIVWKLVSP